MSSLKPTVQIAGRDVPVSCDTPALEELLEHVKQMKAFVDWCANIDDSFVVNSINIQSIDMSGSHAEVVKFKTDIADRNGATIPSIVVLRGECAGVFVLISCEETGKQYTVLTVQPRAPTGKYSFVELPTGTLDDSGEFVGPAAKEIKQELGIEIPRKELYDLTAKACGSEWRGLYSSAAGCDEVCRLFLYCVRMSKDQVESILQRCTGVLDDGEKIKLKIISVHDMWRGCGDVKALAALCIYENLVARRELPLQLRWSPHQ